MSSTAATRDKARAARAKAHRPAPTGKFSDWDDEDGTPGRQDAITKRYEAAEKREQEEKQKRDDELVAKGRDEERKKRELTDEQKAKAKADREGAAAKARRERVAASRKKAIAKRGKKLAAHPVKATQSGSLLGLLVGSLGLILLYDFLQHAEKVPGFLNGVAAAVSWLASPTAVIPFAQNR
jgi:hypothetical protein